MGKRNLFTVGGSHVKIVEKDLTVHHLSDNNISLKCKSLDDADYTRIQYHLMPSLHEEQIDSMIHLWWYK